jgi:hypothetical protein
VNVSNKPPPDNLEIFRSLCEANAVLWQAGEFGDDERALQRAVDHCYAHQRRLKLLGRRTDAAQAVMAAAFKAVRDDL